MFNFAQKVGKYLKKYFLNKKEFRCFFTFYKMEDFLGFCTQTDTRENGILGALYCSSYCMENWRIFFGSARKSGAHLVSEREREWRSRKF